MATTTKTASNVSGADLVGSFTLSYLVSALLIGSLIYFADIWNFLANSRLLDLMIRAGVIKYQDNQAGFIEGIPDTKYFLMSQDPIQWQLVLLAIVLLVIYWVIKSLQFHGIAKVSGIAGTFSAHARAFLYGIGLNKLLPYNAGAVATSLELRSQGAKLKNALNAAFLARGFMVFEILFFSAVGLLVLGWATWLLQIFWALVIFGILYAFLRASRGGPEEDAWGSFAAIKQAVLSTTENPPAFIKLALISLIAFALEHTAAYVTAMAFTSKFVLLNVDFEIILMGLVAGYIARLVPLTPAGWGQFEWGFASALYLGGVGFPESATIAIVFGLIRIGVALSASFVTRLLYGVNTSTSDVLTAMTEAPPR